MIKTFPAPQLVWRHADAEQPSCPPCWEFGGGSVVAEHSLGSVTGTYTGASTKYQIDFEGKRNLTLSGEFRPQGWARYYNEYTGSASLATQGNTVIAGTYAVSFTGTGTITFSGANVGSLVGQGADVTVGATITTTAGTLTSTVTGTVTNAMLENKTGSTNQNPAPFYVDSATAYGANVNAVRYDDHLNASTIASDVLTRATGAKITSAEAACAGGVTAGVVDATGPLGYLTEGARTNNILRSQAFANAAWTSDQLTVTDNQTAAPDGTTTASKGLETVVDAAHRVYGTSAVSIAAGAATMSVYAKPLGRDWIDISWYYNGAHHHTFFDITNGAVGTTDAAITASMVPGVNGWYRCVMTATLAGAYADHNLILASATGDGVGSFAGDVTKGAYLWGAQLEVGTFASSYIPTTTVAVTRNADVLTYPSAGNANSTAGSAYAEAIAVSGVAGNARIVDTSTGGGTYDSVLYVSSGIKPAMYDGATEVVESGTTIAADTLYRYASSWGTSTQRVTANGAVPASGAYDGSIIGTAIAIGYSPNSVDWFGTIRNVKIYPVALTPAALERLTA